jgi:DNA invertase Pin-like site-specific DNA recombinase
MLKQSKRNISIVTKEEIIRLVNEGFTQSSIAKHLSVNKNTVTNVLRRERESKPQNEQQLLNAILNQIKEVHG